MDDPLYKAQLNIGASKRTVGRDHIWSYQGLWGLVHIILCQRSLNKDGQHCWKTEFRELHVHWWPRR